MPFFKLSLASMALSTLLLAGVLAHAIYGPVQPHLSAWTTTVAVDNPRDPQSPDRFTLQPDGRFVAAHVR